MSQVVIARPVNGITLNSELEFLLDDSGAVRIFDSEEQAKSFLTVAGVDPERRPEPREIDGSLKSMQGIVGGLIQPVYLEDSVVLICNEDGKMLDLSANRGLRDNTGRIYDVVFGTFFLCGVSADSENFISLTQEQMERYWKQFYTPKCSGG